MDRLCGNESSTSIASRRIGFSGACLLVLFALSAAVPGPATGAGPAAKSPPGPQPQKLWNAYPLERQGSTGSARGSGHGKAAPAASRSSNDSGRGSSSFLLWVALVCFGASLVAFAVGWREASPARRFRRSLITFGDGLGAFAADVVSWAVRPRATPAQPFALPAPAHTPAEPHDLKREVAQLQRPRAVDDYDAAREQAVLKRKRAAVASDEIRTLRAKNGGQEPDGRSEHREAGVLKAKLAASPPPVQKGER